MSAPPASLVDPSQTATPPAAVLTGAEAAAFLSEEWPALYEADPRATPYQAPTWLGAWAAMLRPPATPLILTTPGPGGRPVAALALALSRGTVTPLSEPEAELVRPIGPAAEDPAATIALESGLLALARQGLRVVLCDVPGESSLGERMQLLANSPRSRSLFSVTDYAVCPLPVAYAEMSRSTRRDHARRRRDWEQTVGQNARYHRTRTTGELLAAWDTLSRIHSRRWGASNMHAADADRRLAAALELCGPLAFISTITLDERVAAAQLFLHRGARAYSLRAVMDPDYAHLACGHALLREATADMAASGFTELHLGRTVPAPGQLAYKAAYGARWTRTLTLTGRGAGLPAPRAGP